MAQTLVLISPYKRAQITISYLISSFDLTEMIKFLKSLIHNVKRKLKRSYH